MINMLKSNRKITFSPLIVGVMNWGCWGKDMSNKQMGLLINQCVDAGLTSFDHAAIYGGYTTEATFGSAFSQTELKRSEVQLISKCGIQYPSSNMLYRVKHYDYSAAEITRSVEQSLTNLKTDYLDVLLLHRPSPIMHVDEVLDALTRLLDAGKILSFGVSNFEPSKLDLIRSVVSVAYNQIEFSLSHHEPLTDGQLDYMQMHQIQAMAWKPLGNVFSEAAVNPNLHQVLTMLSDKYECAIDVLLLAWILKHPAGIIPVIGTTSIVRLCNQKNAAKVELHLEDWFAMYEASLEHKVP